MQLNFGHINRNEDGTYRVILDPFQMIGNRIEISDEDAAAMAAYILNDQQQPAMKKQNPPIALQLDHHDAGFYDVGLSDNAVHGLFEAHDRDQEFSVGFDQFLESCYKCGVIADYADGCIYIPGDNTDRNARQWAEDWIRENAGAGDFRKVLADAVWSEFVGGLSNCLADIQRITPATIAECLNKRRDASFCEAILSLARIIEANEVYLEEVEKANA